MGRNSSEGGLLFARAVVVGAEKMVPRRDGILDFARIDDAVRVVVGREDGVRRALDELVVCIHCEHPTNPTGCLAVAFFGGGVGSIKDLLEVRETGRCGVSCALMGNVLGCATPYGGDLRCLERADKPGTNVVDGGDAICMANGFCAVAVIRIDDRFSGG